MEPHICIKLKTNIPIHSNDMDEQTTILEQHNGRWVWAIHTQNKQYYTNKPLKEYIEQMTKRKHQHVEPMLYHGGNMYVVNQNTFIHIGYIYIEENNATLHTTSTSIKKYLFNVNHIITAPPKKIQHRLQRHIPMGDIINYYHAFPHQHQRDRNILFHYHPHISMHIPCAITMVNPKYRKYVDNLFESEYNIHNTSIHEELNLFLLPEIHGTEDNTHISVHVKNIPNIYKISTQKSQYTQNIEHIKQYLHEIFMPSPLFQQSSQHEQIHMLRAIQHHGNSIAHDIYTTATAHRQHRGQMINLTLRNADVTDDA